MESSVENGTARTVTVGEHEYRVERFTIYKAELVGDAVKSIFEALPAIDESIAAFRRKYREENALELDRATVELRHPEQAKLVSEESWERSNHKFRMPVEPRPEEEMGHAFPLVFDLARTQVLRLLAIVATPNAELEEAEAGGTVDDVINATFRRLRHSDAAEVFELGEVALDVGREQFEAGKLTSLSAIVMPMFGFGQTDPNRSESDGNGEAPEADGGSTQGSPNGSTQSLGTSPANPGGESSIDSPIERRSSSSV